MADRLLEVDLAAVDGDAAGVADRVGDVLRRDGAEQAPVVAGLLRDREDRAVEEVGVLLERVTACSLARVSAWALRWAAWMAPFVAGWASLRGMRKLRR